MGLKKLGAAPIASNSPIGRSGANYFWCERTISILNCLFMHDQNLEVIYKIVESNRLYKPLYIVKIIDMHSGEFKFTLRWKTDV